MNASLAVVMTHSVCENAGLNTTDVQLIVLAMPNAPTDAQNLARIILVTHGFVKGILWGVLQQMNGTGKNVNSTIQTIVKMPDVAGCHSRETIMAQMFHIAITQ